MRGRKPLPAGLKILRGNPGKRRINKREPQPVTGAPEPPEFLSGAALAEWQRITPELERLKLLARVDRAALAGYCECWATFVEAVAWMAENGKVMTVRDDKGNVKYVQTVPQFGMAIKALDRVRAFCSEFGLTPSARTRLQVTVEPETVNRFSLI
jgi:P27 family predicted phage terminase small subunit